MRFRAYGFNGWSSAILWGSYQSTVVEVAGRRNSTPSRKMPHSSIAAAEMNGPALVLYGLAPRAAETALPSIDTSFKAQEAL